MNKVKNLYRELAKKYGRPEGQWKLWCKRPKTPKEKEEVIIGAILTQRTNWKNVGLSINNLKAAGLCSLQRISRLSPEKLASLIKPSGFYKTKADYLLAAAKFFAKKPKEVRRDDLLLLRGVGKETADSILLYALDKPIFVVDEYTRRLVKNKRLAEDLSYDRLQKLFEGNIAKSWQLYQDFHALIVIDGKNKK